MTKNSNQGGGSCLNPWTVLVVVGNNLCTPGICKTTNSSIRHLFRSGGWVGGSPPILSLFGFSEMSDNWRPPLRYRICLVFWPHYKLKSEKKKKKGKCTLVKVERIIFCWVAEKNCFFFFFFFFFESYNIDNRNLVPIYSLLLVSNSIRHLPIVAWSVLFPSCFPVIELSSVLPSFHRVFYLFLHLNWYLFFFSGTVYPCVCGRFAGWDTCFDAKKKKKEKKRNYSHTCIRKGLLLSWQFSFQFR